MNSLKWICVLVFFLASVSAAAWAEQSALEAAYGAQGIHGIRNDRRDGQWSKGHQRDSSVQQHDNSRINHESPIDWHHEQPAALQTIPAAGTVHAPNRNRTFGHHSHHQWHPRYNYYHSGYHMYPYVYVSPTVYVASASVPVTVDGNTYYYEQGNFYENQGQQYSPIAPPLGATIPTLPEGGSQVIVGDQVYYVFNGVYYKPVAGGYQVVTPPSS